MLEDDSGRIRLVGDVLKSVVLVTGCIIAVMGTENVNGEFEVIDLKFPDLPAQLERWQLTKPPTTNGVNGIKKETKVKEDVDMTDSHGTGSSGSKIAIVSGLNFSGSDASYATELNLLLEYLLGEALDPAAQKELSHISRLIIAGNSIAADQKAQEEPVERKSSKKYGYDSSSYNALPSQLLDDFLAEVLPTMPVSLLPGDQDPANHSFPQQPIHAAMFPRARHYSSMPGSTEVGWFDTTTNPLEAEIDGWRILGTAGQNVDDVFKYIDSDDRLGMMEAMCRWRCCAPTAPDTLCEFACVLPPQSPPPHTQLLIGRVANKTYRELSLPGRRSIRDVDMPTRLLRGLSARIRDETDSGAGGPVCPAHRRAYILGDARDRAGRHGNARCSSGQDSHSVS